MSTNKYPSGAIPSTFSGPIFNRRGKQIPRIEPGPRGAVTFYLGWEYQKDDKGELVFDSAGKPIKTKPILDTRTVVLNRSTFRKLVRDKTCIKVTPSYLHPHVNPRERTLSRIPFDLLPFMTETQVEDNESP